MGLALTLALLLTACSGNPLKLSSAPSIAPFIGRWVTLCGNRDITTMEIRLDGTGSSTAVSYLDDSCTTKTWQAVAMIESFAATAPSTAVAGASEVTVKSSFPEFTPFSAIGIAQLLALKIKTCDGSEWSIGKAVPMPCFNGPSTSYDIRMVEGTKLWWGFNDSKHRGTTPAQRPTELNRSQTWSLEK